MAERFKKKDMSKFPFRHSVIIEIVVANIVKCVLRYLLMAAYIWTCNEFGLLNHSFIAKVVIWLTSIYLSRVVMREIGYMIFGDKTDDDMFATVGIVECIRNISRIIRRW